MMVGGNAAADDDVHRYDDPATPIAAAAPDDDVLLLDCWTTAMAHKGRKIENDGIVAGTNQHCVIFN